MTDVVTRVLPPRQVERRCHDTVALLRSARGKPFAVPRAARPIPLQVSAKAEVFRLPLEGDTRAVVVKRHAEPDAYARERLGYELLGGAVPLPTAALLWAWDARQVLVLEDVETFARVETGHDLAEAAATLGRVHAAAGDRPLMEELFGGMTLGAYRDASPTMGPAVDLLIEDRGRDHLPLALGDLKQGHLRRRGDGTLAFVDVETFTPGLPETLDLLMLLNLAEPDFAPSRAAWRSALRRYLLARGDDHELTRRVERSYRALELTAIGLGLRHVLP